MISLEDITVRIGDKTLVEDVSLQVRPGRVTALIGPNGSGKSTLLRTATGAQKPTRGRITLEGRPLSGVPLKEQARIRAVVAQHASLSFPFEVLNVVLMGRTPHLTGAESAYDVEVAWAALDRASVRHLAGRTYTSLSGGERQRVDLARALAQIWDAPPGCNRYLFLDEPTASLDIAHQHETLQAARHAAAQSTGVLVVLHDLNLAAQYADEVVLLCQGRRLATGPPADVLEPDLIRRAFSVSVLVTPHPCHDCPLIVPIPQLAASPVLA
jgi:iron complex transport system ATP-binding protein